MTEKELVEKEEKVLKKEISASILACLSYITILTYLYLIIMETT